MSMPWIAILRDALAIVVARSLVKATLGAFGASAGAQDAVDFGVLAVAFCAIGCASPVRRFPRLGLTAAATWAVLLGVAILRGAAAVPHGRDLVATLLAMLVGGAASLAIVRPGAVPATDGGAEKPPGS
jgi:hypothetical protein